MKVTVVGIGYVGLSLAIMLSMYHEVIIIDINEEKVANIKQKISPIQDSLIQKYLQQKPLSLSATTAKTLAYSTAEIIFIATPTSLNEQTNKFDTVSIENVMQDIITYSNNPLVVIKSTIPIGYTQNLIHKFSYPNIVFSPEFLREGSALADNLSPSRIVVGGDNREKCQFLVDFLKEVVTLSDVPVIITGSLEAESIKLFANTYLAMRVAYFNELDTFCEINNLNTKDVIQGLSLDKRIGNYYNNPSFGYGGYCLPKDSKQLLSEYNIIPQALIQAVITSNQTRKEFIVQQIIKKNPKQVGIYRLTMKKNSDNIRSSAILDIISMLSKIGIPMVIYEPLIVEYIYQGIAVTRDLKSFLITSDVIVANRLYEELKPVVEKVYSRDLFDSE